MGSGLDERLRNLAQMGKLVGESTIITHVQNALLPHIISIFTEHGADDLERMIITDYALVEKEAPEGIKRTIRNLGSNPKARRYYEELVVEYVRPENILEWMRNPEEWLDVEEADQQRAELKRCADVLEETPGGQEWLAAQVWTLYRWANIVPEDSTRATAND